jgi:hypoxanthine phosphoribosyltransferase
MKKNIYIDFLKHHNTLRGVLRTVPKLFYNALERRFTNYLSVAGPSTARDGIAIGRGLDIDVRGRHVILVEDIVNTGLTIQYVFDHLQSWEPASVAVCALLDKTERRIVQLDTRYVGFTIPNEYVVGYGLDHHELYRNLPFICVLKPHAYESHPVAPPALALQHSEV